MDTQWLLVCTAFIAMYLSANVPLTFIATHDADVLVRPLEARAPLPQPLLAGQCPPIPSRTTRTRNARAPGRPSTHSSYSYARH